jgi:hypothetical protein
MGVKPPPSILLSLPPLEKSFFFGVLYVILARLATLGRRPSTPHHDRGGEAIDTLLTNTTDATLCDGGERLSFPPLSLCHVRKFITNTKI